MAFDRLAKGETDAAVEEMVNEAVRTIESIADDAWISWVGRLIPNIVRRVREETEARDRERERRICEEAEVKERLVREEAEREVREEVERVTQRERHQQEKLDLFLNESITAEEFEKDSEAEAEVEVEESEVTGVAIIEDKVGAQVSEMEVDDAGEDEVVVEDLKSKGGRKQAPSSPPKPSRKQTRMLMAIGSKPTVIERIVVQARLLHAISAATTTSSAPLPTRVLDARIARQSTTSAPLFPRRKVWSQRPPPWERVSQRSLLGARQRPRRRRMRLRRPKRSAE